MYGKNVQPVSAGYPVRVPVSLKNIIKSGKEKAANHIFPQGGRSRVAILSVPPHGGIPLVQTVCICVIIFILKKIAPVCLIAAGRY